MPKKSKPTKRAFYQSKPPKPERGPLSPRVKVHADKAVRAPADFPHTHAIAPAHFLLRDDGTIGTPASGTARSDDQTPNAVLEAGAPHLTPDTPHLILHSDTPFLRLYHGNSLELLDAIAAKYPEGRFDMIFADPPYFLSNPESFRGCQRVLKPNGTIWVSGTHHVIFSIGYALQEFGYNPESFRGNDIAWEKPNPPPNLSCRYFTHSTETILWAAKNDKSKHTFNYQEMHKVTGKQMKTVWRKEEFPEGRVTRVPNQVPNQVPNPSDESGTRVTRPSDDENFPEGRATRVPNQPEESGTHVTRPSDDEFNPIWTLTAPGSGEKEHGKHPTQKPVALIERCVLASTRAGDLVLDPFLGGGTTAVACVRLKRGCVGIELDFSHVAVAARRSEREIIEIVLRTLRVRIEVSAFSQNDLDLFSDSINGSRVSDKVEVPTERIFHECKFVFLSCAHVERGAVVHTTVDVSLQEAWAKTPNGKKRETTHVVRCETEIFRVKP